MKTASFCPCILTKLQQRLCHCTQLQARQICRMLEDSRVQATAQQKNSSTNGKIEVNWQILRSYVWDLERHFKLHSPEDPAVVELGAFLKAGDEQACNN